MSSPEPTDPGIAVADETQLRAALDRLVADLGTQRDAAASLGISAVYLSDVINGRRDIGALAARLGYRPLILYVPDGEPSISPALAARVIEKLRRHRIAMPTGGAA